LIAIIGSVGLAILSHSALVERAFYPFAVAMQVTPIVAGAPLLPITYRAVVRLSKFRRVLSSANTTLGLSADQQLIDRSEPRLRMGSEDALRLPRLPYFLAGLRISGLALIGAIARDCRGSGQGLACYRIVESGLSPEYSADACRCLISVAGITIHSLTALSHWLLRDWHAERAEKPEAKPRICHDGSGRGACVRG
jgi:NitT/TauT family transport system permease protein